MRRVELITNAAAFSGLQRRGRAVCVTHTARHVSQINNLRVKFGGSVIGVGSKITKIAQNLAGFCRCWGDVARENITVLV